MARITEEQYMIKDLEIKSALLKEINLFNKILAYRFGPGEVQLLGKLKEELKNEFESISG